MAVDKSGDIQAWLRGVESPVKRDVDPFPLSEIPLLPKTSPGKPAALSLQEPPPGRLQPPMASKFPLRPVLKKEQAQRKLAADAPKEAQHPEHGASTSLVKSAAPSQLFACKEDSMVRFLLLNGRDLDPVDDRDSCDPYVVFKLGNEKYTSRVIEDSNDPVWNEPFDIFVGKGKSFLLQVMVMDKDPTATSDFIGRFNMNLTEYEYGEMYEVKQELDDDAGEISFRMALEKVNSDECSEVCDIPSRRTLELMRRHIASIYVRWNMAHHRPDLGEVLVLVHRASTIAPPYDEDKLDAFCAVELGPKMLWNRGNPKTVSPIWNTMFRMRVKDIHAVLQVTVVSDMKNKDIIGAVAFPLISVETGKKLWFALKDQNLEKDTGGFILLELYLIYNTLKAAVKCLKKKDPGPQALNDRELTRAALTRNMARVKAAYRRFKRLEKYFIGCIRWDSIPRSVIALVVFVCLTLHGEPYMVPWIGALFFLAEPFFYCGVGDDDEVRAGGWIYRASFAHGTVSCMSKESLKSKLRRLQSMAATMQNAMGAVASYAERAHNVLVFTDPFVSKMFLFMLIGSGCLAYIVPARYWILMLGLRLFIRGFLKRTGVIKDRGNDLRNLFQRTPDNFELSRYSVPLPSSDTIPRGTFAAKPTFSLRSLRRLFK
ncbi:multiple C2 and transmembrane domain-containing protein 1-like [Haemaphysalis longicornis]